MRRPLPSVLTSPPTWPNWVQRSTSTSTGAGLRRTGRCWLVVSEHARGQGIGRVLMAAAMRRFIQASVTIEVVTFGADHPGAAGRGARIFYERLGFTPAEAADPGPEGGSRQIYRKTLP